MSRNNLLRNEATVDAQIEDQIAASRDRYEPELRRSVEQEIQGKVDTNHPDSCRASMTLAQEEEALAREVEIERTTERARGERVPTREAGARETVRAARQAARREFDERAASVDRWQAPERADPRSQLRQEELARVNEQAGRLARELEGWTRAAVSRRLAERVVDGDAMTDAVVAVYEELATAAGTVISIDRVDEVDRGEVSIEGTVIDIWETTSPAIQDVGLLEDESGRIKFTLWTKSQVPTVEEGDHVVLRTVAKNWHEGRCSVAATGRSRIEFPERGQWWSR